MLGIQIRKIKYEYVKKHVQQFLAILYLSLQNIIQVLRTYLLRVQCYIMYVYTLDS